MQVAVMRYLINGGIHWFTDKRREEEVIRHMPCEYWQSCLISSDTQPPFENLHIPVVFISSIWEEWMCAWSWCRGYCNWTEESWARIETRYHCAWTKVTLMPDVSISCDCDWCTLIYECGTNKNRCRLICTLRYYYYYQNWTQSCCNESSVY